MIFSKPCQQKSFATAIIKQNCYIHYKRRWNGFSSAERQAVEALLLRGCDKDDDKEKEEEFIQGRDYQILEATIMVEKSRLPPSLKETIEKLENLKKTFSDLKDEDFSSAVHSSGSRSRTVAVSKDTDCSMLLNIPVKEVIQKAREVSQGNIDFGSSVRKGTPFDGLSIHHPDRALEALLVYSNDSEFPKDEWTVFLGVETRNPNKEANQTSLDFDEPQFICKIATAILSLSNQSLAKIMYQTTWWLEHIVIQLDEADRKLKTQLINHIIDVIRNNPSCSESSIISGGRNIIDYALNSPSGRMVQIIQKDSQYKNEKFDSTSLDQLERLIKFPEPLNHFALAMIAWRLSDLRDINNDFFKRLIIPYLKNYQSKEADAIWVGAFYGSRKILSRFTKELKQHFINWITHNESVPENSDENIALSILDAWLNKDEKGERFVSSAEAREMLAHAGEDVRSSFSAYTRLE